MYDRHLVVLGLSDTITEEIVVVQLYISDDDVLKQLVRIKYRPTKKNQFSDPGNLGHVLYNLK